MHLLAAAFVSASYADTLPTIDDPLRTGVHAGEDAAVVIGIEDYLAVPDVPFARADAQAMADWLIYTRGIPIERVQVLTSQVSVEKIRAAVNNAAVTVGPEGRLWVYFAGHGATDPSTGDRLWLGDDVRAEAESFQNRGIGLSEVRSWLEAASVRAVLVSDACFTGAARDGTPLAPGGRFVVPASALPPTQPTVVEWFATSDGEVASPLTAVGHGAFTFFAIGALRGWADGEKDGVRDGQVSVEEAQLYVQRALRAVQIDTQRPVLRMDRQAAAFPAGNESGPDLRVLARLLSQTPSSPPAAPAPLAATVAPPSLPAPVSPTDAAISTAGAAPDRTAAKSPAASAPVTGGWLTAGGGGDRFDLVLPRLGAGGFLQARDRDCATALGSSSSADGEGWWTYTQTVASGEDCPTWTSVRMRAAVDGVTLEWEMARFGKPREAGTLDFRQGAAAARMVPPQGRLRGSLLMTIEWRSEYAAVPGVGNLLSVEIIGEGEAVRVNVGGCEANARWKDNGRGQLEAALTECGQAKLILSPISSGGGWLGLAPLGDLVSHAGVLHGADPE